VAAIVAKRLVAHLEEAGFVVMKRPPSVGAAALGRGYEGIVRLMIWDGLWFGVGSGD
jgi:hypothetical protein